MNKRDSADDTGETRPRWDVQLLIADTRNRELLADWLAETYDVAAPADGTELRERFDVCIVDEPSFARYREFLTTQKEQVHPAFLPVVLVSEDPPSEQLDPAVWDDIDGLYVIDEVVAVPVDKSVLYRRLENLLERRSLSRKLAGRVERTTERFRTLLDGTPDPVFVLSADHELLYVNDALVSLLDVSREDLLGSRLVDVPAFSGPTAAEIGALADRCFAGDPTDTEVVTYGTAAGERRFADINVDTIDAGEDDEAVVIMRDVTERRERERDLRESERRFRATFENSHDALLIANDDAEYVDANPAACELVGVDRDRLLEMGVADLAADDVDAEGMWDAFLEEGSMRGEFPMVRPDGERRILEFHAVANVRPGRHLSALRDVTDRVEMERELRRSEKRFRQMAANVREIIWMTDGAGEQLLYVSPGVEDLTGVPAAAFEADPTTLFDVIHPEDVDSVRSELLALFADRDVADDVSLEFRVRRPDDTVRWVEFNASAVATEDGGVHRYVGLINDITDLKERQRELRATNERLDQFASLVSHDLRNPLQAAMARLEVARERDDLRQLDEVEFNLDRIDELINDFLKLAREGEPVTDAEPVELAEVAEREWARLQPDEATLSVETDATIRADPDRLGQLLGNLFRNALEHAGLDVTVRVGTLPAGACFYVADDGPGIPADERDDVFDKGYFTGETGTGLGLAIVDEIATAHDWLPVVTDAEEGGARFAFTNVVVE